MNHSVDDTAFIVPAAGSSTRFGGDKLMSLLDGIPVYLHCIRTVAPLLSPGRIILAVAPERIAEFQSVTAQYLPDVTVHFVPGGASRTESVFHALEKARTLPGVQYAAVHDAARPFLTAEAFMKCLDAARVHQGALLCRKICDTVKRVDSAGYACDTLNRDELRAAETPQIFSLSALYEATEKALQSGNVFTDDCQVMETFTPVRAYLVEHYGDNRKITFAGDLPNT